MYLLIIFCIIDLSYQCYQTNVDTFPPLAVIVYEKYLNTGSVTVSCMETL